jgi:hypothetical protein
MLEQIIIQSNIWSTSYVESVYTTRTQYALRHRAGGIHYNCVENFLSEFEIELIV